ncbi:hypothetical protein KR018_002568, partial [Drosophila ironensis]
FANMSHTLPPPPPPPVPPTPPALPSRQASAAEQDLHVRINITGEECEWAWEYPELQLGCYRSRVCQFEAPKRCQYYSVDSIIQEGPTCGLTALSMLLGGQPTAEDLLKDALAQEYTLNGEIFSGQFMYELTRKYLQGRGACQLHEGHLNCHKVKELLNVGGCLLVPYDTDVNHAPCLKSGHTAHWALIVGFLVDKNDTYYVLARHGKTRYLAVWPLESLSNSNANLVEFAQPKGYISSEFVVPSGGISGSLGLNERSILVNGLPQQVVHVR